MNQSQDQIGKLQVSETELLLACQMHFLLIRVHVLLEHNENHVLFFFIS
jgi:hypothetical protein